MSDLSHFGEPKGDTVINDAGMPGTHQESVALEFVRGNGKYRRVVEGTQGGAGVGQHHCVPRCLWLGWL